MDWITETLLPPPASVTETDEALEPRRFIAAADEGHAFLWTGDFHRGKQFLIDVDRLIQNESQLIRKPVSPLNAFLNHRKLQARRAGLLARLLVRVEPNLTVRAPRAPDTSIAIGEALEKPPREVFALSLRELLGMIGAHEWRKKGVQVPALGAKIHPFYGVFSPARGEYLDLLAQARLPIDAQTAFDIGTGTGVIAALLAKRGLAMIIATDNDSRALACARANLKRLGFDARTEVRPADLFPEGAADLIVCNPPWIPGRPSARIEAAVYDPKSRMLRGFLSGALSRLNPGGEAWLILSNFAELLGLRQAGELETWIEDAGLSVLERLDTHPRHAKSHDKEDPLYEIRSKEITSLWRLGCAPV